MGVTKYKLKPSECVSRIGDSASVQAVTRVNAEQALYEAFEVKHYLHDIHDLLYFLYPLVSLFELESRFFAPTHECLEAGARRDCQGRPLLCAGLTLYRFRPRLDRPEHGGNARCGRGDRSEGSSLSGTSNSRRNLVSGRSITT